MDNHCHDARPARLGALVLITAVLLLGIVSGARAQSAPNGAALYRQHCASCHGAQGTGNGPMALMLRHAPPDLTVLSRTNNGVFPDARVRRIVDGREVESHGNRDMPVWGDEFRLASDGSGQTSVSARITALVRFLESIQQRNAH